MPDFRPAARWINAHMPATLRRVVARAYRLPKRGRTARERWEGAIVDEVTHWREAFATDHAHVAWLSNPQGRVLEDSLLGEVLAELDKRDVDIIDVGSGPMTPLGHIFDGKILR